MSLLWLLLIPLGYLLLLAVIHWCVRRQYKADQAVKELERTVREVRTGAMDDY